MGVFVNLGKLGKNGKKLFVGDFGINFKNVGFFGIIPFFE